MPASPIIAPPGGGVLPYSSLSGDVTPHWRPIPCRKCVGAKKVDGYDCDVCDGTGLGPQAKMLLAQEFEVLTGGGKGGGKGLPNDGLVLTPYGLRPIGELSVGDRVMCPDNTSSKIIGVYELGERDLYRVTFIDGASDLFTDDHLWPVSKVGSELKAQLRFPPFLDSHLDYRLWTTREIEKHLEFVEQESRAEIKPHLLVPLTSPLQVTSPQWAANQQLFCEFGPYFLGALLGDGCLSTGPSQPLKLISEDEQIVKECQDDSGVELRLSGRNEWVVQGAPGVWNWLERLRIAGKNAAEKEIPEVFFIAPLDIRWALIQGLMDTDGYVDSRGHCSFTSTSSALAEGVQRIARSLGFKATLTSGKSGYRDEQGHYIRCRDHYDLHLQGRQTENLFRLERKRNRCREFNGGLGIPKRRITSITLEAKAEARCIKIDHPAGLFIAGADSIVTHNTDAGIVFGIKGNTDVLNPKPRSPDASYAYHPKYRCLVIRKNYKDLEDWISRALEIYDPLGARLVGEKIVFPSGARIILGHMEIRDAFHKYSGREFQRMLVEEANLIPDFKSYMGLRSSCRSTSPELKPQIMLTVNPIGPGLVWLTNRFVDIKDDEGMPVPWGQTIYQNVIDPETGKEEKITRVFIPARLADNPYLMRDKIYRLNLATLPDAERRALLDGDWYAFRGTYFDMFRELPRPGEPENACHVIKRHKEGKKPHPAFLANPNLRTGYPQISHWWPRAIGGDWGYSHESAIYWGCRNPETKQLHIYRELAASRMGLEQLGVQIAKLSSDELERAPGNSLIMWFSPDTFKIDRSAHDGPQSMVELIVRGIQRILGPDAAHAPELDLAKVRQGMIEEGMPIHEIRKQYEEYAERTMRQRRKGITIRRANNNRILGWQAIRSGLEWEPPAVLDEVEPSMELYLELKREYGEAQAQTYLDACKMADGEYPRILIWDTCPKLMAAIPKAVYSETVPEDVEKKHFDGMDELDGCRYLVANFDNLPAIEPSDVKRERMLDQFRKRHPGASTADLIRFHEFFDAEQSQKERDESMIRTVRRRERRGTALANQISNGWLN